MLGAERRLQQARGVLQFGAELGGVAAGVDLEENGQLLAGLGGGAIQEADELLAVHALHAVEVRGGELRLVRLQVADQLPAHLRRCGRAFVHALLHAIFPHGGQPVARGVFDGGGRVALGHGEQTDLFRRAARAGAGGGEIGADGVRPAAELLIGDEHGKEMIRIWPRKDESGVIRPIASR